MKLLRKQTFQRMSLFSGALVAVVLSLSLYLACNPKPPASTQRDDIQAEDGPNWFEDVTEKWGFDFVHDPGPIGTYFTPQSMGSGAAVFDFDGDGLLDIYMLNFAGPKGTSVNRLFRQIRGPNGPKFEEVTKGSGLDVPGYSHGVAIGDVNNDGKPDVLLTQFDGIKLFLNRGDGRFEDATAGSGLVNPLWGMSAAFLDYDRDGWLDLVVVNYLDFDPTQECWSLTGVRDYCGPRNFAPVSSKLFHNLGATPAASGQPAKVRFQDVSFDSGIGQLAGPGLGVVCADFSGTGWPDIFVANDGVPNRLWVNKPDPATKGRKFTDDAITRGVAYTAMGKAYAGMGVAVGDINNDGMLDLYVTHLGSESNNLWQQGPRGKFRDKTADAGLSSTKWRGTGFGTLMADFNNDGWVDIAVANGRVFRGGDAKNTDFGFWETYLEKNQLLMNDGTGRFMDISLANNAFCGHWNVARGLVCADFDNDGGQDLLVAPLGGRARIFRNVAPNRGHWLKVRAIDPRLNREAYGAEIRAKVADLELFRVLNPAESYLCSSSPLAAFGLGKADRYDSIAVQWPDGLKEVFPGGPADIALTLKRGEGRAP